MRHVPLPMRAVLLALATLAGPWQCADAATRADNAPNIYLMREVWAHLDRQDCPKAIGVLNGGIKSKQRDLLYLTGTMYEKGVCFKPDWEKAAHFYQLANEAGHDDAVSRLVAGYALPGRDGAVALWWAAHERKKALPRECIPAADPDSDVDGFEAGLKAMSPSLFNACVYTVGVYFAIHAETQFPEQASKNAIYGEVKMHFVPAEGAITWTKGATEHALFEGVYDVTRKTSDNHRAVENTLLTYMIGKSKDVLPRYAKPKDINPDWRVETIFSFDYTH